uniref:Uncharacterized protein n=1 Tax=Anguilla anguilla TaxID=7936 RepID=A0A0E9URG2_ANGAN
MALMLFDYHSVYVIHTEPCQSSLLLPEQLSGKQLSSLCSLFKD